MRFLYLLSLAAAFATASSENLPKGVKHPSGQGNMRVVYPTSSVHVDGIGSFASGTRHHQNTFEVQEKHEKLTGKTNGVKFNVETLTAPEEQHRQKPKIEQDEYDASLKENTWSAYSASVTKGTTKEDIRIETASTRPNNLVHAGGQGFFAACLSAFAQHLPLALSPDHIWALITYAFAQHVDQNAEQLRSNFVKHEGKISLEVRADHMVMGGGYPSQGSSPETWEASIFPSFSEQIKEHVGNDVHATIVSNFTTTSPVARAANEITLMSAMKHYFDYEMMTKCGIPTITLLGSEEDWVSLRAQTEALGKLMTPDFNDYWMPKLLPVLDEFIESYRGNVNHGFWQSMVKLRLEGGSGGSELVSGWIQIFFPYLKDGELNEDLRPWEEMYFDGPAPNDIPPIVSSAPVEWNYHGAIHNLHFFAGFTGCSQDEDGTLTPEMGWYVAHDLPRRDRVVTIKNWAKKRLAHHFNDAQCGIKPEDFDNKTGLLYERVSAVLTELQDPSFSESWKLLADLGFTVEQNWCKDCDENDIERKIIQEIVNELDAEDFLDRVDESRE